MCPQYGTLQSLSDHSHIMPSSPLTPAEAKYVSLRTYRKTGTPVDTAVWIAAHGDSFYIFSAADAGKIKRLRHTRRIGLAECDVRGNVSGPWVAAEATLVAKETHPVEVQQAFVRKYGWAMRTTNFFSRLTGRYHKRQWIEIRSDSVSPTWDVINSTTRNV